MSRQDSLSETLKKSSNATEVANKRKTGTTDMKNQLTMLKIRWMLFSRAVYDIHHSDCCNIR